MQPTILVTGGTGFLGSHLLRQLLQAGQTEIRALRRSNSKMDQVADIANRIEWVEGDVLDIFSLEDALVGIRKVYHCAAVVSFDARDREQMQLINVEGTANVVNLCLDLGIEKLLHVSSVAALGRIKPGTELDEKSSWQTSPYNSQYGVTKFLAEQEVWRGMAEGLSAVIINPSIILGPGRWDEGPAKFFPLIHKGFRYYPAGTTGIVVVQDVAAMMIQLMDGPYTEERFIANAGNLSYSEFFRLIAQALQVKAPSVRLNAFLKGLSWRMAWLQARISGDRPLVTQETARQSALTFYFSNKKSIDVLGFSYTPIEQTIAATAQQYLSDINSTKA
jgi:nucleoside-diphosphate-sugar epimerase